MRRILRLVQTSSPSFILMMALDDARDYMEIEGREKLQTVSRWADEIRETFGDPRGGWREEGWFLDPTRLVLPGGAETAKRLEAAGIDVEMHDDHRAVCILSAMDGKETFERLKGILASGPLPCPEPRVQLPMGESVLSPREAALGKSVWIPLEEAAGRIAACAAGLYPPGIPLANPGERYSEAIIDRLLNARAQSRFGLWEGKCACVEE